MDKTPRSSTPRAALDANADSVKRGINYTNICGAKRSKKKENWQARRIRTKKLPVNWWQKNPWSKKRWGLSKDRAQQKELTTEWGEMEKGSKNIRGGHWGVKMWAKRLKENRDMRSVVHASPQRFGELTCIRNEGKKRETIEFQQLSI